MMWLRAILAVCLTFVLIVTSGAMAVARGEMASGPGLSIVICNGAGTEVLTLDSEGNPVAPPHACPDCALIGFAPGFAQDMRAPRLAETGTRLAIPASPPPRTDTAFSNAHARAPPTVT